MTDSEITLRTAEGIALPRAAELVAELTREHGAKYIERLTRAVEASNHDDKALYMIRFNAAVDALPRVGGDDRHAKRRLVTRHVALFCGAMSADIQMYRAMNRAAT